MYTTRGILERLSEHLISSQQRNLFYSARLLRFVVERMCVIVEICNRSRRCTCKYEHKLKHQPIEILNKREKKLSQKAHTTEINRKTKRKSNKTQDIQNYNFIQIH